MSNVHLLLVVLLKIVISFSPFILTFAGWRLFSDPVPEPKEKLTYLHVYEDGKVEVRFL